MGFFRPLRKMALGLMGHSIETYPHHKMAPLNFAIVSFLGVAGAIGGSVAWRKLFMEEKHATYHKYFDELAEQDKFLAKVTDVYSKKLLAEGFAAEEEE